MTGISAPRLHIPPGQARTKLFELQGENESYEKSGDRWFVEGYLSTTTSVSALSISFLLLQVFPAARLPRRYIGQHRAVHLWGSIQQGSFVERF